MTVYQQLRNFGLFDARVPRYTSYPTATHFSKAIGPADTNDWLCAVPENATVSLYVHIPFCRRLCWFCACRTQGTTTLSPVAAYVETLKQEIDLVRARLPAGVTIEHLHWGGGTPTLLAPNMIRDLADTIFARLPLAEAAQFSVEIDPGEIDEPRLDALSDAGMNRASIGVQDFDPEIQATIGREQGYDLTRRAVDGLRARGISSLNMDILFGLPHQTGEKISDSVEKVLSLSPDRIALFGYAHVPWMAKRQVLIPTDALPTPEARLGLFETAQQVFLAGGYEEIGIDHFARPDDGLARARREGSLRRNFQGYTEDTSTVLIGLGASAISRYPQGYAQNAPATPAYQGAVRSGRLATSRGHRFAGDDLLRARMIEMLLCDFEIDFARLETEFGTSARTAAEMTAPMAAAFPGMTATSDDRFRLRPEARALARMAARQLDAYEVSQSGHSHAI